MTDRDDDALMAELCEAFRDPTPGVDDWRDSSATLPQGADESGDSPWSHEAPPIGQRLGDFEIMGEIGRGGMGIVYRAKQLSLNREVALKVLPAYARHGRMAVHRFRSEARAAAKLNHTNVVPVYAQGEYQGHCYYAMKLVQGESLDVVITTQPHLLSSAGAVHSSGDRARSLKQTSDDSGDARLSDDPVATHKPSSVRRTGEDFRYIASLVVGVADGLAHAHANGVIHRDIKPHNLILGPDRRLYITDFGLAHLTDEPHMTLAGEVMGTPSYLSPEQARGDIDAIDARTDIYSLGVTLYEMITDQRPFVGRSRDEILQAVCKAEPKRPRRIDRRIPVDLETICLRSIEKSPARRYASAAALADDLQRFAEGRPILSRRIGIATRAAKWARRHKPVVAALAASLACIAVTGAWAVSSVAAKHRQGQRLIDGAYDKLLHLNYREPQRVAEAIDEAIALGATGPKLQLVQALASLGASEQKAAIEHLEVILTEDSQNVQALYALAWAQWRELRTEQSRRTFQEAEELGGPGTPEEWFLRGLAVHQADPDQAIESYRTAKLMRAANHEPFPQAGLHLARAQNQRMYATRTINSFDEAQSSLRQLIADDYYGGYPYYLLSITYRLAGEIYDGSPGVRGDGSAGAYFEDALYWAREGQAVAPDDNRPVTAESECLEQLGRIEEALASRDRGIELANDPLKRCEGYHYRWRLHYWLGHLDEALQDVERHAICVPEDPFYAHFYPALLQGESGNLENARQEARVVGADAASDDREVLIATAILRLLGRPDEAVTLLMERMGVEEFAADDAAEGSSEWVWALYEFSTDQAPFAILEQLAEASGAPWTLLAEAYFHAGVKALGVGDREEARSYLDRAYRSFDGAMSYTYHAKALLGRLADDANWPPWIPVPLAD